MKKNIPLLKKLRTRFLRMRHVKHFKMEVVTQKTECGAAMCIAGHTLDLAGYTRRLLPEDKRGAHNDYRWLKPSGQRLRIDPLDEAQRLLGLTENEAFYRSWYDDKENGLFLRFDLRTPKQAAAEIQKLIDTK